MIPWFFLSYPRCRTAWLSVYLTGAGVPCFHEAWKDVENIDDLRNLMESRGDGTVANADCANIFFLKEIQEEFPEAKFVKITRTPDDVYTSLVASYGPHNYRVFMDAYAVAMDQKVEVECSINFDYWNAGTTKQLWSKIEPNRTFDASWALRMEEFRVTVTKDRIKRDFETALEPQRLRMAEKLYQFAGNKT